MNEIVKINSNDLAVKTYKRQRVVTFEDVDTVHERPSGTAKRNFSKNQKRFTEGKHFFCLKGLALKDFLDGLRVRNSYSQKTRELMLITEKGYLLLVKSFNDDLAWRVQEHIIDNYFRAKEILKHQRANPEWQQARVESKRVRLKETDEVKKYVDYCRKCGSSNADNYYASLTKLANNAVGIASKQRDFAVYETLQILSIVENSICHTIAEELQKETEYHQIYNICKDKISSLMTFVYLPEERLLIAN